MNKNWPRRDGRLLFVVVSYILGLAAFAAIIGYNEDLGRVVPKTPSMACTGLKMAFKTP